jgi:hypothetical protein
LLLRWSSTASDGYECWSVRSSASERPRFIPICVYC